MFSRCGKHGMDTNLYELKIHLNVKCEQHHLLSWNPFLTFDLNTNINVVYDKDLYFIKTSAVGDPGFPRGGGANPQGGANIEFCQMFPKTARN